MINASHGICPGPRRTRSDKRAPGFEEQFGKGQTELDALEALHPGMLAQIITAEIERYYDPTLGLRTAQAAAKFAAELRQVVDANNQPFEADHAQLEMELDPIQQQMDDLNEEFEREVKQLAEIYDQRAAPLFDLAAPILEAAKGISHAARVSLDEQLPDVDALDWPVGMVGDEDPDPLFDSTRGYVEQVDRYKAYQGKPISRKERELKPREQLTPKQRRQRDWHMANREAILTKQRAREAARKPAAGPADGE